MRLVIVPVDKTIIEPMVSKQWFVDMRTSCRASIEGCKDGDGSISS